MVSPPAAPMTPPVIATGSAAPAVKNEAINPPTRQDKTYLAPLF